MKADNWNSYADNAMERYMSYRAVIFDLDGTLLDTLGDIASSCNNALTKHGFPIHPTDAYRYFVGDGAAMCVKRALPEGNRDDGTVRRCLEAYSEDYGRNWDVRTRPYDGVPEMLDVLKKRGLMLAVLSNKPHEFTQRCVREFFSDETFDIVIGYREPLPLKPDPSGALDIVARLGVEPAEFLYLGDTSVDMKTAVTAGMYPVGALWGFRPLEELRESGARTIVAHPMDILTLLD